MWHLKYAGEEITFESIRFIVRAYVLQFS